MRKRSTRRWSIIPGLLLTVPVLAVGLVLWQGRHPREDPAHVLAALRAQAGPRLPSVESAGAGSATDPARYDRETLYQLVDGAADALVARGFERCIAATYAFPAAGGIEIAAEAHRFRDERGARAQAEAERPTAAVAVAIPEAVTDGQVLLAVSGRDLLKLASLSIDPRGREALLQLATAWRKEQP